MQFNNVLKAFILLNVTSLMLHNHIFSYKEHLQNHELKHIFSCITYNWKRQPNFGLLAKGQPRLMLVTQLLTF